MQLSAPDDGRKHRPKHVELARNNKLTYIVASCWIHIRICTVRLCKHETDCL